LTTDIEAHSAIDHLNGNDYDGRPMTAEPSAMEDPFEVVSVQHAEAPPGAEGSDWHRYVISQGINTINGCRQGNLKAVTEAVDEIVAQLNRRRLNSRGRVQLVITPQKKVQN
jgi:hypothetical protein